VRFINYQDDGDFKFETDDGSGGTTEYLRIDGGNEQIEIGKNMRFADNVIAKFGTGGDLQIKHNATASSIENYVGDLTILNTSQDNDIVFKGDDGQANTAVATYFLLDGSAAAHDGSATTALYTVWPDNSRISVGSGRDLQLHHSGSTSKIQNYTGNLEITNQVDDGDILLKSDDGSGGVTAYLTLDGGLGYTTASKAIKFLDNVSAAFGTGGGGDYGITHDGTDTKHENYTGDLKFINYTDDKDIIFQSDDGSGGVTTYFYLDGSVVMNRFVQHVQLDDDIELRLGTNQDLRLEHTGSNGTITNYTGDLTIQNNTDDGDVIFQSDDGSGGTTPYLTLDGGDVSTIVNTIKVLMPNLPTSDPSVAGQLWNDSGTLKISAG